MEKTYLELLAENDAEARQEFEPNPKELFVDHGEYDDIEAHGKEHDELEDQEAFQQYPGSHQQAAKLGELAPNKITHVSSVEYDKAVQVHVLSIDSRFRTNPLDNPSNFLFKLITPIKNVVTVRLSSLEIPNTWYLCSNIRGTTSFDVFVETFNARVVIPEGNYSLDVTLTNCLQTQLVASMQAVLPAYTFTVTLNPISGLLSIACFKSAVATRFALDFTSGIFSARNDNWGLGYILGFRQDNFVTTKRTASLTIQTGTNIPDLIDCNYIFLSLNPDWRVVEHNQPDRSNTAAFAKVIVDVPKNDIVYDNGSNTITKTYKLKQPTNITGFTVSFLDEYEQFIQLMGGSVSLTLELTEVLNSALYESLRN
jgi:hypothetical protein